MVKIVFTPDWFLTSDVLIEIFSFLILCLFFMLAFKSYQLSKKKSVFYLGLGFFLIALAELSTILTKIILYYDTDVTHEIGKAIITYEIVKSVDIFYYLGFFLQRFLTLLGLYVIYKIPYDKKLTLDLLLSLYLIFVAALLSNSMYYFYHLTALVLLVFISRNYYKVYRKKKIRNTRILAFAFVILALSQTIFILSKLNSLLYATAQLIQLAGYIILLILIMKIIKNGKKEKQGGDNPRHA